MSLGLNGSDEYVTTSSTPITEISSTEVTIALWGYMTGATGATDYLCQIGAASATPGDENKNSITVLKGSTGSALARNQNATNTNSATSTATNTTGSSWIHYAGTWTGEATGDWIAYLDGGNAGASASGNAMAAAFTKIRIGADFAGAQLWAGYIAHVAIWNKVLTAQQISDLYNGANPLAVEAASLVAYWPFTDSGDLYSDVVGTYDLTASGTPFYSSENPTVNDPPAATVKKLKLLAHSSAQSDTGVSGVVFDGTGYTTGDYLGTFTGAAFESTLESGYAVLKVPVADFGGEALTTSSTPSAFIWNSTDAGIGPAACTVIEE